MRTDDLICMWLTGAAVVVVLVLWATNVVA